ncbi:MAG TPA: amino acid adenylation domain-containing protein [Pyrinomonadaceae bacterium]
MQNQIINGYQLSPQQKHLWLLQSAEQSTAFYAQCAILIEGPLDAQRLRKTVETVVERHEIFRTGFQLLPGMSTPLQVINETAPSWGDGFNWETLSPPEQDACIEMLLQEERHFPFDLQNGLLSRFSVVTLDSSKHVLLATLHALCADIATLENFVHEIASIYASEQTADEPMKYIVASEWLNEMLESEDGEAGREFWRRQIPTTPATLKLPYENTPSAEASFEPQTFATTIPAEVINALATNHNATTETCLLACWTALLGRLFAQSEITIGAAFDGRTDEELQAAFGPFMKYLPVRSQIKDEAPISDIIRQLNDTINEGYAWQECFTREATTQDSFPSFGFDYAEPAERHLAGDVVFSILKRTANLDRFKVRLSCAQLDTGLNAEFHYDAALVSIEQIQRLAGQFRALVQHVANAPATAIGDLQTLSDTEQQQLLIDFNATLADFPSGAKSLPQLFEEQVARTPGRIALTFENQHLTYAQLNERANQLARVLRNKGVVTDSIVAICTERSFEMVIAIFATLKAGAAYVPLDPAYPQERLAYMLEDSRSPVLLTQQRLVDSLPAHQAEVICVDADADSIAQESAENLDTNISGSNLAYVIYTSGSTGQPKGVLISHASIVNHMLWMAEEFPLTENDSVLQKTPFSFDASVWEFYAPLFAGARLVMAKPGGHQDSRYMVDTIRSESITILQLVPSLLRMLLDEDGMSNCESLRRVYCGGEALTPDLVERFYSRMSGPVLHNLYGPTEATIDTTFWICPRGRALDVVPIGGPVANTQVYIVDKRLQPVPTGIFGELCIGGIDLARGYLNRPELTAQKFVPDPFAKQAGGRLYRTGDLARFMPDGNIEFVGRIDQQVKLRGFLIEPGDVEAALMQHSGISQVVVVAREDATGAKRLVAYYVPQQGEATGTDESRRFLKTKLPEYMIPQAFVSLDSMPLTPNGKVDRRALPDVSSERPKLEEAYVAPTSEIEEVLAAIWAQVLGIEEVGVNDNFFALGGDSIRSVRVVSMAKERGLNCTVQQLFEHQTVHGLARVVTTGEEDTSLIALQTEPFSLISAEERERLPEDVVDAYPLTKLQAGMLYHMELTHDSPVYHNVSSWHLRAHYDRDALQEAVNRVVVRHPILRTSFDLVSFSEPLQLVHREAYLACGSEDLRHLSDEEQRQIIDAYMQAESRNRFDLSAPPLLRLYAHRRTDDTFQFTLTEFHPIFDGWSLTSTLTEIFENYFAIVENQPLPEAPPTAVTFRDYVALERKTLESPQAQRYWYEKLQDATPLELPRWRELSLDPGERRFTQSSYRLSAEVTEGLKRLASLAAVPLKNVLLAAHFKALSVISGQQDIVTGMSYHGRPEDRDGDQVRGLFINTVPFRVKLGSGNWIELVQQTFDAERELMPFKRYPLAVMQKTWGRKALLETSFNFVHFHSVKNLFQSGKLQMASGDLGLESTSFTLDVAFILRPTTHELNLVLGRDRLAICDEQMEAIRETFMQTLAEMAADPLAQHGSRCLISIQDQQRILEDWNDTAIEYPDDQLIHQIFESQAAVTPDRVALTFEGTSLTYRELNEHANRLAHYLRTQGVGVESRVGILLERSPEMVISLLATLKASAAYVPLDPAYPKDRLIFMLEDAQVPVLLTQRSLAAMLPEHNARTICLDEEREIISRESAENPVSEMSKHNLAYMIYTSGSTGKPKGAMNTHLGILNRLLWMQDAYGLNETDSVLQKTPFSFDVSVWEFFWPLMTGARLVVARPGGHQDSSYLVDLIADQKITTMHFVPSMLQIFLEEKGLDRCDSLKRVICSGEALSFDLQERFFERMTADLYTLYGPTEQQNQTELHNLYGPTEAAVDVTHWQCVPHDERGMVPIGRPIANTQIYILDEHMHPAPVGVAGELFIGGVQLARGYHLRPELTAEKFIPNPYASQAGGRLYRTGDLARYLPDGPIEFIGRLDNQVKLRGFRIELGEIETAIVKHESARDTVAMVREDEDGTQQLVAYVVPPLEESAPTVTEFRGFLKDLLPEYMIPMNFVPLESMPLTPNGKVDRMALPAPANVRPNLSVAYADPKTKIETDIATVWREVLGIDKVGLNDNFFELGGDSIRILLVLNKLKAIFGEKLSMPQMFEFPTISLLAAHLNKSDDTQEQPVLEESFDRAAARRKSINRQAHR